MKRETLKEIGKGVINFANLVGGLSIINGFFGQNHNLPQGVITGIVIYFVFALYVAGAILINKGAEE